MGLKKCLECGEKISKKAKTCPQCGAPRKQPTGCFRRFLIAVFVLFVVVIIITVIGNRNDPTTMNRAPATRDSSSDSPTVALPSTEQLEAAIAGSDDLSANRDAFISATKELIQKRKCTLNDIKENGGWVKSQNHKIRPVYFTYCGGSNVANRIYLDVSTGEIFE